MGQSVLMVNLLWALHIILFLRAPDIAPLSVAIGLGLHWIIFGWIIGAPLGIVHAVLRTLLFAGGYLAFPRAAITAVSVAVVLAYATTVLQLLRHFRREAALGRAA